MAVIDDIISPFICNLKKKKGGLGNISCPRTVDVSVADGTTPPAQVTYSICGTYGNPTFVKAINLNNFQSNIYRYTKAKEGATLARSTQPLGSPPMRKGTVKFFNA